MKNICFFIGNLNLSAGTERVSTIIANELVRRDYKVVFLSLHEGSSPAFTLNDNIEIYSLSPKKTSNKWKYLTLPKKIRKFLLEKNIDTLISVESMIVVFSIPALIGLKIRHISWEHFNFTVDLGFKPRVFSRYLAAVFCDYVVTLTKTDKEIWKKKTIGFAKITSIHNPSSFTKTTHVPKHKNKTVIAVGRHNYQKGFDLLVSAWEIVSNTSKDWKLEIIGDGENKDEIYHIIEEKKLSDSIKLIPNTDNIEYYYKTASFFCLSSRYEGLPMVLLEAQSFNLPIVSYDCLTGPKELIEDGMDGLLVEPENIDMLAAAISRLINHQELHQKMVVNLLSKNNDEFSIDSIIDKWDSIL